MATGRYLPTVYPSDLAGSDYAIITVSTPLRDTLPDLTSIEGASTDLAKHLTPGATVVLESTTYPDTTEELTVPILEHGSGPKATVEFEVRYSPERINPGNATYGFVNTPKVVAGLGDAGHAKVEGAEMAALTPHEASAADAIILLTDHDGIVSACDVHSARDNLPTGLAHKDSAMESRLKEESL